MNSSHGFSQQKLASSPSAHLLQISNIFFGSDSVALYIVLILTRTVIYKLLKCTLMRV